MKSLQHFRQLHHNATPLLIANVWDANSAQVFEAQGYAAVGTSSAALANTYGFQDGESLPFEAIVDMAKYIVRAVQIPVSVDIEGGYGRTASEIAENIERLFDVGVVGVNLEDTVPHQSRYQQPVADFQRILNETITLLQHKNVALFVNVRTDAFLLGLPNALEETLQRVKAYENAGADGVFVPCITAINDIDAVVKSTALPINVMAMPQLPDFDTLQSVGVKRISMGNFLHQYMNTTLAGKAKAIRQSNSFVPIF